MRLYFLLFLMATVVLVDVAVADDYFADNFNEGFIDPAHWNVGGAITVTNGAVALDRQSPGDSLATISTYSGDYRIELDSRLDAIVWNDMFHGIAVMNSRGAGISFGYSMYGKLYLALSDGTNTGYNYAAAGSNQPGTWLHWTLIKSGSQMTVQVNGVTVFGPIGPMPDGSRVLMPGLFQDGDGGGYVGYTNSTVDNFIISPANSGVPMPAPMPIKRWGQIKKLYNNQ